MNGLEVFDKHWYCPGSKTPCLDCSRDSVYRFSNTDHTLVAPHRTTNRSAGLLEFMYTNLTLILRMRQVLQALDLPATPTMILTQISRSLRRALKAFEMDRSDEAPSHVNQAVRHSDLAKSKCLERT